MDDYESIFATLNYIINQVNEDSLRHVVIEPNPIPTSYGGWPLSTNPRLSHTRRDRVVDEMTSQSSQETPEGKLRNCSDLSSVAAIMYKALTAKSSKLIACPIEDFLLKS